MARSKIFFRTDASFEIGYGHVYRCLALADYLKTIGDSCIFLCKIFDGNLIDLIISHGHEVKKLSKSNDSFESTWLGSSFKNDAAQVKDVIGNQQVDYLIIDHYGIDYRWEKILKKFVKKIIVIDDLANRSHDCNYLIDQNLGRNKKDYENLTTSNTEFFIGPKYALLRPEFNQFRKESLANRLNPSLKNILINFGGVDVNNYSEKILSYLKKTKLDNIKKVEVVIGKGSRHLNSLQSACISFPYEVNIYSNISNMAEIMSKSDLIIGAAGSSSWERCSLGIPSIILILAPNQEQGALSLEANGCAVLIKNNQNFDDELNAGLHYFSNRTNLLKSVSACKKITEGLGINKLAKEIFNHE